MQITSRFTIAIHILGAIDYFHGKVPVNSTLLAQSIGANPVIVRGVMAKLSKAGYILASKGMISTSSLMTVRKKVFSISMRTLVRTVLLGTIFIRHWMVSLIRYKMRWKMK